MRSIFDYKDNLHNKDDIQSKLKWGNLNSPKPEVSILMPVYNHPHFFKLALDTAISQDYEGLYEIIILDNNQDDDIDNVNEFEKYVIEKNDYRILYYKNIHNIQGINSYNRLPQLARADYFIFLHDDDELCPNCLSVLMKVKEKNNINKELIIPDVISIDKNSLPIYKRKSINSRRLWGKDYLTTKLDWFFCSYTNGGGVLHNRQAFLDLGGYCSDFIPSADYAFYILYFTKFGAFFHHSTLFRYRWAENDSMIVYKKCAERDSQFRSDMMKLICIPNFILRRFITSLCRIKVYESDINFKGESKVSVSFVDKTLKKLSVIIRLAIHII